MGEHEKTSDPDLKAERAKEKVAEAKRKKREQQFDKGLEVRK